MTKLKLFLPVLTCDRGYYLSGHIYTQEQEDELIIYITDYFVSLPGSKMSNQYIYGYYGDEKDETKSSNYIKIASNLTVTELYINNKEVPMSDDCVVVLYDYHNMKQSQVVPDTLSNGSYFDVLYKLTHEELKEVQPDLNQEHEEPNIFFNWLSSSMLFQHIISYAKLFIWLSKSYRKKRKLQVLELNFIVSFLTDLMLGIIVLKLLVWDKDEITAKLMELLEKLVSFLFSLLKWLMGSPAGLKLNKAFNKMLGKYFSYHIQLWWLFLDVSGEKLGFLLYMYQYLGYIGFSFQVALVCDIICVATFHSFCIYIYAARLFNIQLSGIIALTRLFVGRKYNPLRGGVDSHEYTEPQMYIGTLAFAILLLLMPTTLVYYTVFTIFRVLSLAVQNILTYLIFYMQNNPLYVSLLWLFKSSKISGNIYLEYVSTRNRQTIFKMEMRRKDLKELVKYFRPPLQVYKSPVDWSNLVSNVLTGKKVI